MVATEFEVCNQALALLSFEPITAYTDDRVEAQRLGLIFAQSRDELLRQHAWSFATVRRELVTTADAGETDTIDDYPGDYTYVYVYPADCLRILKILDPSHYDRSLPFQIISNPYIPDPTPPPAYIDPVKRVLTQNNDAVAEYIYQATDVTTWDAHFVRCMEAYLAWKMTALRPDERLRRWANQIYQETLQSAMMADSAEQNRPVDSRPCRYRDARN